MKTEKSNARSCADLAALLELRCETKTITQIDYTAYEGGYQLRILLECDVHVPKDDPVRLLSVVLDRVDYRRINAACSRYGSTPQL